MTDTPSPVATQVIDYTISTRLRFAAMDTFTMARRDFIRVSRQPDLIAFSAIMGVFFLVLFDVVFGGAISAGTGIDYTQFLVPGLMVITPIFGGNATSIGIAEDLGTGVNDRFRSLPMSQVSVLAGRCLSDVPRNFVAIILVVAVSYPMGFRFTTVSGAVGAIAISVAMGYAFSWVSAAIAAALDSTEAVQMAGMFWLMPLMFASNAFAPTDSMPGWLQSFAENQPISIATTAARGLAGGTPVTADIVSALAWTVGLVAVFAPLATRLYARR
jgi:ABC-2 type transport system permease protein